MRLVGEKHSMFTPVIGCKKMPVAGAGLPCSKGIGIENPAKIRGEWKIKEHAGQAGKKLGEETIYQY